MIEGLEISQNALAEWLERHVAGFAGLRAVAKFATGQSNPTYQIEAASDLIERAAADRKSASASLLDQAVNRLLITVTMVPARTPGPAACRQTPRSGSAASWSPLR